MEPPRREEVDFRYTCDNPHINKWISSKSCVNAVLTGRQQVRELELSSSCESLFPDLNTLLGHNYAAPEQLIFGSMRVIKAQAPLSGDENPATFWICLPLTLAQRLLQSGTLTSEDLNWGLCNLQLAVCPRSAVLLSVYSSSIGHAQGRGWQTLGPWHF